MGRPNVGTVFTPIEDDESKTEEDTVEETESDWEQNPGHDQCMECGEVADNDQLERNQERYHHSMEKSLF